MNVCLWVYRQLYWCRRSVIKQIYSKEEPSRTHVHSDILPWFWIGVKYSDDNSITLTEIVNQDIEYGMRVTPKYLSSLTGHINGTWRYIDAKTLEEHDFPSDGFIIEDVVNQ